MSGAVTIERAENGWIVRRLRGDGVLGSPTPAPLVFDTFERLADWLAMHYKIAPGNWDRLPYDLPTPLQPTD
jgi:hypothetical protein